MTDFERIREMLGVDLDAAEAMLDEVACDPDSDDEAARLELASDIAHKRGRDDALALLERALAVRARLHGKSSEAVARTHSWIARLHYDRGELELAVVAAKRATTADDDPGWLVTLGDYQRVMFDTTAAEATYKRALAKLRGVARFAALRGIAGVYMTQGNNRRARKYFREALALVDEDSVEAGHVHGGLGQVAAALGDHAAATEHFERALELLVAAHGELHEDVSTLLNNMSNATADDVYAAAAAMQYAVAIGEHIQPDHPNQGTALGNLAFRCSEAGQPATALAYAERALAIEEKHLGRSHPTVLATVSNMAHYEKECGRPDLALARANQVAVHHEALVAADHEMAASTLFSTGQMLLELGGDRARGVALITSAFEMRERLRRDDDEGILNTARNAAACMFVNGAIDEAVAFLQAAKKLVKDKDFKTALAGRLAAVKAGDRDAVVETTEFEDSDDD